MGITLAVRILPDDRPAAGPRPRLDVLGLLLTAPGVVGVIYGLSNVSKAGGAGRTDVWLPVVLGVVLVAGFVRWAWGRGGRALIDIRLFRHRPLAIATLLMLLMGFTLYGSMLLLPLFWQELRGHDALGAGLLLIPQGVGALVSRTAGGRATDDIGPRMVAVVGFAVVALATVPFAFADQNTGIGWLIAALTVRGFGLGLVLTPLMGVAFVGLDRTEVPHASIITRVAQQLGGSFGTAVLAVILERGAAGHSLAGAFDVAFWWASGFTALAVVVALVLPRQLAAS